MAVFISMHFLWIWSICCSGFKYFSHVNQLLFFRINKIFCLFSVYLEFDSERKPLVQFVFSICGHTDRKCEKILPVGAVNEHVWICESFPVRAVGGAVNFPRSDWERGMNPRQVHYNTHTHTHNPKGMDKDSRDLDALVLHCGKKLDYKLILTVSFWFETRVVVSMVVI